MRDILTLSSTSWNDDSYLGKLFNLNVERLAFIVLNLCLFLIYYLLIPNLPFPNNSSSLSNIRKCSCQQASF